MVEDCLSRKRQQLTRMLPWILRHKKQALKLNRTTTVLMVLVYQRYYLPKESVVEILVEPRHTDKDSIVPLLTHYMK